MPLENVSLLGAIGLAVLSVLVSHALIWVNGLGQAMVCSVKQTIAMRGLAVWLMVMIVTMAVNVTLWYWLPNVMLVLTVLFQAWFHVWARVMELPRPQWVGHVGACAALAIFVAIALFA